MAFLSRSFYKLAKNRLCRNLRQFRIISNQVKVLEIVRKLAVSGMFIMMNNRMPDHAFLVGDNAALLSCNRMMLAGNVIDVVTTKNMSSVYGTNVVVREIEDMARKVCIPCSELPLYKEAGILLQRTPAEPKV